MAGEGLLLFSLFLPWSLIWRMCSLFGLVFVGMFLEWSELENLGRGFDSPRKLQFLRNPHAGHLEQPIPRRWKRLHVRGFLW